MGDSEQKWIENSIGYVTLIDPNFYTEKTYSDIPNTQKILVDTDLGVFRVGHEHELDTKTKSTARLVMKSKKSEHITPILIGLHWLHVQERIIFKLLLNTYKALHGLAPDYLSNLLSVYKPARSLRSSSSYNLSVPRSRTVTYGDRTFACACPKLWNQLPLSIRLSENIDSFKMKLKTFLFKTAYNLQWVFI